MSFLHLRQFHKIHSGLNVIKKLENYGYHRPFRVKNQYFLKKSGVQSEQSVFLHMVMNFIESKGMWLTLFSEKDKML